MKKTESSLYKDSLRARGDFWIKTPSKNYRQSGGVEFRGKYVTAAEYLEIMRQRDKIKKFAKDGGDNA